MPSAILMLFSAPVILLLAGCAGLPPALSARPRADFSELSRAEPDAGGRRALRIDGLAEAEPGLLPPGGGVPRTMPALTPTIYAHGAIWVGYNMATAQGGHLEMFDAGEGMSIGVAFGNGQDVKRFFEIAYEATGRHNYYAPAGGSATYERVYLGFRRYLLPVAAEESRRIAPLTMIGVTLQNFDGGTAVPTPVGNVQEADGIGFYAGTGIEFYVGGSSQVAISLDVRVSVLNFDGSPESTGRQREVGGAMAVVYHF